MFLRYCQLSLATLLVMSSTVMSQSPTSERADLGSEMLNKYFNRETKRLADACLTEVTSLADWESRRVQAKQELLEMLGLAPLPPRTELKPVITHTQQVDDWVVESIQFQSRPGLYVTGNLYRPVQVQQALPAVLYVCGHGGVKKDGVSYGNKVHYQHHGEWFARNGYVCLTIDSLQLGEIEGIHHGTHRYNMWWWLNRGYTPAGVEAWNCVRALDYLETRNEVDASRIGVTGRSGGGAYSWWIAAIDDRIQCAVPVAGVTDLENHVIDGCIEGHCDCMFFVNTFRWDYPMLAAMVAPRPLLISNTDSDSIFPLEGVVRTHAKVRHIYELYGKPENVALQITAGPHQDTQELRIHAFRWLNHFLKEDDSLIELAARPYLAPEDLQVFRESPATDRLPQDSINANIHETFVPRYTPPPLPRSTSEWESQLEQWQDFLDSRVFRGWPDQPLTTRAEIAFDVTRNNIRFRAFDIDCQAGEALRLYVAQSTRTTPKSIELCLLNDALWAGFQQHYREDFADTFDRKSLPARSDASPASVPVVDEQSSVAVAYFAPRGIGRSRWDATPAKQTQIRRRFYLLGQTLDGMQVWDQTLAMVVASQLAQTMNAQCIVRAEGTSGVQAIYAASQVLRRNGESLDQIVLQNLPTTHREGPFLLNVNRLFDVPHAIAMLATSCPVQVSVSPDHDADLDYPRQVANSLGWDSHQLKINPSRLNSGEN